MAQIELQINHAKELEILDSFHRIQSSLYQVMLSPEMDFYYTSTADTIDTNKNKLMAFLKQEQSKIPYLNSKWTIYGSRGSVLFSTAENTTALEVHSSLFLSPFVSWSQKKDELIFSIPTSDKFDAGKFENRKNVGVISLIIPFQSITAIHRDLISIDEISFDLSSKKFHAQFQKNEYAKSSVLKILYLYIFIFFVFNFISTLIGIKLIRKKIDLIGDLQQEVYQSSKLAAIGNVAHLLAHDIKKPFSKIFIFLDMIEKSQTISDVHSLIHQTKPSLKTSSDYIDHMLNEITDASITRINTTDDVDLETLIHKARLNLPQRNNDGHMIFDLKLTHSVFLKADFMRLMRVFSNLIANAMDAMNGCGKIWIHSKDMYENQSLSVEIIIGNSNSHIEENDLPHIFEPFYTTKKEHGTGLGLAISQKIIGLHGGKIQCFSDREKGVEFRFCLPAGNPLEAKTKKTALENHDDKKNHDHFSNLIVIDDDPFILKSWRHAHPDKNVLCFTDPHLFLKEIENKNISFHSNTILVSDFYFTNRSNFYFFDFAKQIRDELRFQGAFFLSTDAVLKETKILQERQIQWIPKSQRSV